MSRRANTSTWILVSLWALAVAGFFAAWWINTTQTEAARDWAREAESVEEAILDERWRDAAAGMHRLRVRWEKTRRLWALHTEHQEMDEITDALTEARAQIDIQEAAALVSLRRAKDRLLTLPERDAWDLENIF